MLLRPATPDDAPQLRELVRAAYRRYVERMGREPRPMREDYAQVIDRLEVTVADDGGSVAGMVVLHPGHERGFLVDNVAVQPARRGMGVGRALLEHAEREALARGHDTIVLYTHSVMIENLALYERIGYVEYDREPSPPGEVVHLRKALAGAPVR